MSSESIVVEALEAGKTMIIDGIRGIVTVDGKNAFNRVNMWEFPRMGAGEITIGFSSDAANAALLNDLKEECYIRTKTDEYVLKEINEADDFNTYTATLNVEELESKVFKTGFETVEKTIMECLQIAFDGTGWSIRNCEVTKRRTIRESDQQTAWSVLQKALSTYRCECIIDTLQKKIDIYDRIGEDKGAYFIEGLNLKK